MNAIGIRAIATPLLLGLFAVLAQWTLHDRTVVPMDEGHLAAAASWMRDGKLLYRDIHTGIFPGIYVITAGLFGLFGEDLRVTRLAAVVMNVVIVIALWSVARRMVRPHWALLPPLLYLALIVVGFPVLSMFNYSTLSIGFGLLALVFLLRYLESASAADGLALGAFVAAAALTKQNFGALIFVSLGLGLAVCRNRSALADRPVSRVLLPIIASGGALTTTALLYFAVQGTLGDLFQATVFALGGSQMSDFNNPIPPLLGPHPLDDGRFTFLYTPPTLFNSMLHGEPWAGLSISMALRSFAIRASYGLPIAAVVVSLPILAWTRQWRAGATANASLCAVLFACLFFPGIFPSAIWSHLAFVMIPALLLFAFLANCLEDAIERRSPGRSASVWTLRGPAALLAIAALVIGIRVSADVARWYPVPLELERATLRVSERELGLLAGAVRFVDGCAAPGEPILALPDIPIVYFLSDRPNPSPFDLTIPGNVDGTLIARRIDEVPIRCIVLNPQMYLEFPPFKVLFPILAHSIEQRFQGDVVIRGGDSRWIGLVRRRP